MAESGGGGNPGGQGFVGRMMSSVRGGAKGGGPGQWASGGLSFDTKGVQEFTKEIGKAEKAIESFVKQVDHLKKSLGDLPEDKIKALQGIGSGGGQFSNFGGQAPSKAAVDSQIDGGGGGEGGGEAGAQSSGGGSKGRGWGWREEGAMGLFAASEIVGSITGRFAQRMESFEDFALKAEFANTTGALRSSYTRGHFATAPSWTNLRGAVNPQDAAALNTQSNFLFGSQLGGAQQQSFNQSMGLLNVVNPQFGGASSAMQGYQQSFMTNQAYWNQLALGITPAVQKGKVRDPEQFIEDVILRMSGQTKFGRGGLTEEMAAEWFGAGGTAQSSLGRVMPGITPEMTDTLALVTSGAARYGGFDAFLQSDEFKGSSQYKKFGEIEQAVAGEALAAESGRGALQTSIDLQKELNRFTKNIKEHTGAAIPILGTIGSKLDVLTDALVGAAAVRGYFGGGGGWGNRGAKPPKGTRAPGGGRPPGGGRGMPRGLGWLGRIGTVFTLASAAVSTSQMDDSSFDLTKSVRDFFSSDKNAIWGDDGLIKPSTWTDAWDDVSGFFSSRKMPWGDPVAGSRAPKDIGDPGDGRRVDSSPNLNPGFSSSLRRLFEDAPFDMTIVSGYRSPASQERIFYDRMQEVPAGTPGAKEYKGKHWRLKPGEAPVAVPGRSKHQKGHAVDVRVDGRSANSHKGWQRWIDANASKYGIRHGASFGEWWHLETPGTVSESGGSSTDSATPTPRATTSGGGSGGGGMGSARRIIGGSAASIVSYLSKTPMSSVFFGSGSGGTGTSGGGGGGEGVGYEGEISQREAYELAMQAGFSASQAKIMAAIAVGESSLNPMAHNPDSSTGDNSYGLWQINMLGSMGPARRRLFGIAANSELFDPLTNAKAAKAIFDQQGYRAWSVYKSGEYQKYIGSDVGDAVASQGSGGGGGAPSMTIGGGTSVVIQNLNLNVKVDEVSPKEARRLAKMTVNYIREEASLSKIGGT